MPTALHEEDILLLGLREGQYYRLMQFGYYLVKGKRSAVSYEPKQALIKSGR
jgi:hypothetical protein